MFAVLGMATIGFNSTRIGGWTVSDLVFLGAAGVVVAILLNGGAGPIAPAEMRRSSPLDLVGSLLLLTGGALSSLWALDPTGSMMSVVRFGWLTLAWFWLLRAVSPDRTNLVWLVRGYRVTVLVSGVVAFLGFLGLIQLSNGPSWENRQAAFYGHSNQLAAVLAIGLPFCLLDIRRADAPDRPPRRARRLVTSGLVLVGIGATGSITGLLGGVVALAVMGLIWVVTNRRRWVHPLRAMALLVVITVALVAFARSSSPVLDRLTRWASGDAYVRGSVETRDDYVLSNLGERLLVGTGLDQLASVDRADLSYVPDDAPTGGVHNMYLKLVDEAGVPAFCGLLILVLATLRRGWRLVLHTRGTEMHPLATALFASLVTANVVAQFQPLAWERFFWLPIALVGVMWAVCRHELDQPQNQPIALQPIALRCTIRGRDPADGLERTGARS